MAYTAVADGVNQVVLDVLLTNDVGEFHGANLGKRI